ncbi:transcriptional activator CadC [bacterium BMS3Abin03]|nr:transcriptional activator CadC [bacterium BMS3Abin03]
MIENMKIYKFGNFTFGVKEYNLKKGNKELYLRPKTYETLLYLVEHHGNLVKKDDIIENVWAGTIVTENTLTQCIKEIREKLNDNSANPKYIKTIPRVGYKFIAPVKEVITSQYFQSENSKSIFPGSFRLNRVKIGFVLSAIFLAAAIFFLIRNNKPGTDFLKRQWVLISDFDNRTGEDVFEAALQTALEMELSKSQYVNVVPRGRVQDILTLMRQKPDIRIDRNLGREICLRDGNIQMLLTGSIYRIGNSYSLSLGIIEPATNRIVKNYSRTVTNQEEILPLINQLAISIRKELGESLENFQDVKTHFEKVTTSSLKALNFYSKGVYYINLFDMNRAEYFLNQAVQYDTTFAMGYVILAFVDLWQSNLPKGKADFEKAAKLATNLSDREKFFILGSNAMYGIGDYKKGIEYYELLLDVYPDDYWGNENLSFAYLGDGDIKQYLKYKKICEKLRPNYFINHSDKGLFSLYYDRNIAEADIEFSRALELNPDYPFEFCYLISAFLDWMHEDVDSAEKKISDFLSFRINKLLPMSQITSRWYLSHFFLFEGRFDEAIKILKESVTLSKQRPKSNLLPWAQLELALVYLETGRTEKFESLIKSVSDNSVGITRVQALGWLAIRYAQTGKIPVAKKLLDELENENRLTPIGIMQAPLPNELKKAKLAFSYQLEGAIANYNSDYKKAIEYFHKVVDLVPSSQLPFLTVLGPRIRWVALKSLAHIYEKMGDWNSAIASYKDILKEKVLTITVPAASSIWVRSLLSMSEVLEKQGNHTKAEIYKSKYTNLWSGK